MKFVSLVLFIFIALAGFVNAGPSLECTQSGHCTLVASDRSASVVHLSANDFARQVGERLKARWPSKVVEPTVALTRSGNGWVLTWSCWIVRTDRPELADWRFDRRGTLLYSFEGRMKTLDLVDQEIRSTGKATELPVWNGWWPLSTSTSCVDWSNGVTCIKEYFFASPKPK